MIEVAIKGRSEKVSKAKVIRAAKFYADKLMYPQLHNNIHVEILFSANEDLDTDEHGYCQPYYDTEYKARLFDIGINSQFSERKTLETLSHEMIHVRQYARNELYQYENKDDKERYYRWRHDIVDVAKIWDWFLPWEIESYGMEFGLYKLFMLHEKAKADPEKRKIIDKISVRKIHYRIA